MLDFGFILMIVGCSLLLWFKLSAHAEKRALTPRPVLLRSSALEEIKVSRKTVVKEAYALMILGFIIILLTGVAN